MSDLTTFRDHARTMAAWVDPRSQTTDIAAWCDDTSDRINLPDHKRCEGFIGALTRFQAKPRLCSCTCHPRDPGPSGPERTLWAQLADEIDAYLTPTDSQPAAASEPLWEDASCGE